MSGDFIDGERLRKLLGGVELANLRLRLRARYERGASRDEFTLTDLLGYERRALAAVRSVVVTSRATARRLADYGVSADRIAVVGTRFVYTT